MFKITDLLGRTSGRLTISESNIKPNRFVVYQHQGSDGCVDILLLNIT